MTISFTGFTVASPNTSEIPDGERTGLPSGFDHYIEIDENLTGGAFTVTASGAGVTYAITEVLNGNGQDITAQALTQFTRNQGTFTSTTAFNHEYGSNYRITVEATDSANNKAEKTIYMRVNDVSEYTRRELGWMTPTSPVMLSSLVGFPTGNMFIGVDFTGPFEVRLPGNAPLSRAVNAQLETVYHYLTKEQYDVATVAFTGTGTTTGRLEWRQVNYAGPPSIDGGRPLSDPIIGTRILATGQDDDNIIDDTYGTFVPGVMTTDEVRARREQEALHYNLGNGRDRVITGAGDDIVDGGAEEDVIDLRRYKDDADRIVYRVREDSGVIIPADGGDKILGFRPGLDEIDFTGVSDFLHRLGTGFRAFLKIEKFNSVSDTTPDDDHHITGVDLHFFTTATTALGRLTGSILEIFFDNVHTIRYDFFKTLIDNNSRWMLPIHERPEIKDIATLKDLLGGPIHREAEKQNFYSYTLNETYLVRFGPDEILPQDLPDGMAYNIIRGEAWRLPATGALDFTWSVKFATEPDTTTTIRADAEAAVSRNLAMFAKAGNLTFTKDNTKPEYTAGRHITFTFTDIPKVNVLGLSYFGIPYGRIEIDYTGGAISSINGLDITLAHEIGHTLGLKHPFENDSYSGRDDETQPLQTSGSNFKVNLGWPNNPGRGDEDYYFTPLTVMSYRPYQQRMEGLQLADKAAIEFLYGRPGTNNDGVQSHIAAGAMRPAPATPAQVGTTPTMFPTEMTYARWDAAQHGWFLYDSADGATPLTGSDATTLGPNTVYLGADLPDDGRPVSFGSSVDTYVVGADFAANASTPADFVLSINDIFTDGRRNVLELTGGVTISAADRDIYTQQLTLTFGNGAKLIVHNTGKFFNFKIGSGNELTILELIDHLTTNPNGFPYTVPAAYSVSMDETGISVPEMNLTDGVRELATVTVTGGRTPMVTGDDRFDIIKINEEWKLVIKDAQTLDADTGARSIPLTISVAGGNSIDVTITIEDVNEHAPTFGTPTGSFAVVDDSTESVMGSFSFDDTDRDDTNDTLTITANTQTVGISGITLQGTYGSFVIGRNNATGTLSWSYALDDSQAVRELRATDTVTDTVMLRVSDGTREGTRALAVNITGKDDSARPALAFDNDMGIDANTPLTLDERHLRASDDMSDAAQIFYRLAAIDGGTIRKGGTALEVGGTFTQHDIDTGNISLEAAVAGSFALQIRDHDGPSFLPEMHSVNFHIRTAHQIAEQVSQYDAGGSSISQSIAVAAGNLADNIITPGSGDDRVEAGSGDDTINLGNGGNDEVVYNYGMAGGDFIAWDGGDTITGFTPGEDRLVFSLRDGEGDAVADFADGLGSGFHASLEMKYDGYGGVDTGGFVRLIMVFSSLVILPGGRLGSPLLTVEFDRPIDVTSPWVTGAGFDMDTQIFTDTEAGRNVLREILGLPEPQTPHNSPPTPQFSAVFDSPAEDALNPAGADFA